MKIIGRYILGSCLSLLIISCGGGDPKGPFFWEMEKDGKISYILGTFHVGVTLEGLQCSSEIKSHLDHSDLLLTEMDQNQISQMFISQSREDFQSLSEKSQGFVKDKMAQMKSKGLLPEGFNVENLSFPGLGQLIPKICLSELSREDSVKFIEQMGNEAQQEMGSDVNSLVMDFQIQQIAQSNDISQAYLDDVEAIKTLFFDDGDSTLSIAGQFDEFIKNYEMKGRSQCNYQNLLKEVKEKKMFTNLQKIIELYKSGEGKLLNEKTKESIKEIITLMSGADASGGQKIQEFFNQKLLKSRNKQWIEKIVESHEGNDSVFIAAEVSHFIEYSNVLDMLKDRGFSVKRFKVNCKAE